MLRAVSARTSVRRRGARNSSLSSTAQPSSTASRTVLSKRPARWDVEPRPLIAIPMDAGYAATVSTAATAA
ncbi:hypothetical protein G6F35_010591 [Rhizopus arrhizus]|nr:hypothetical protein G6F31_011306 [Rhizopus arrhizus]KAG1210478.1 hypothetical protein G6F35_010591 [Rhizopus arrhizus]